MTISAEVESNPPSILGSIVSRPSTPLRSILARILKDIMSQMAFQEEVSASKSNFVRIVCKPSPPITSVLVGPNGQVDYSAYVAFCERLGVEPRAVPVVRATSADNTYLSYAAFCKQVGHEPRTLEIWNTFTKKGLQQPQWGIGDYNDLRPTDPTAENPYPALKRDRVYGIPKVKQFSRCAECATPFTTEKGKPCLSEFRFCRNGVCEPAWLSEHEPARFKHSQTETPITFEGHIGRSANRLPPTRQTGNTWSLPKQVEMTKFAKRTPLSVDALRPRGREKLFPHKSLWCATCVEYVEQGHQCPITFDAHAAQWSYYKTASGNRNVDRRELATFGEREAERLQRVAEFAKAVRSEHKFAWIESFRSEYPVASVSSPKFSNPAARYLPSNPLNKPRSIPRGLFSPVPNWPPMALPIVTEPLDIPTFVSAPRSKLTVSAMVPAGKTTPYGAGYLDYLLSLGEKKYLAYLWRLAETKTGRNGTHPGVVIPDFYALCPETLTDGCFHGLLKGSCSFCTPPVPPVGITGRGPASIRQQVLKQGHIDRPSPATESLWNRILAEENLSTDKGKTLVASWPKGFKITALLLNNGGYELCGKCGEVLTTGERVDETRGLYAHPYCTPLPAHRGSLVYSGDISYFADMENGNSRNSNGRVNTAGNFDTEKDGLARDFSSRDRRADMDSCDGQDREPLTQSMCLWCGAEIWAIEGAKYCCPSHKTRFNEELPALEFEIWLLKKRMGRNKEA